MKQLILCYGKNINNKFGWHDKSKKIHNENIKGLYVFMITN